MSFYRIRNINFRKNIWHRSCQFDKPTQNISHERFYSSSVVFFKYTIFLSITSSVKAVFFETALREVNWTSYLI